MDGEVHIWGYGIETDGADDDFCARGKFHGVRLRVEPVAIIHFEAEELSSLVRVENVTITMGEALMIDM